MQTMTQLGLFVAAPVVEVAPVCYWGSQLGPVHLWEFLERLDTLAGNIPEWAFRAAIFILALAAAVLAWG